MKLIKNEEFYKDNFLEIQKKLVDWSKLTFTDSQAAELAGYKEENWNKIGPHAHTTHIEYLIGDYDQYEQNFDQICSAISTNNILETLKINTVEGLKNYLLYNNLSTENRVERDMITIAAHQHAVDIINDGDIERIQNYLIDGMYFDMTDVEGFIEDMIQEDTDILFSIRIIIAIYEGLNENIPKELQEVIDDHQTDYILDPLLDDNDEEDITFSIELPLE